MTARSAAAPAPRAAYIVTLAASAGDPGAVAAEHARRFGAVTSHIYRHALRGYAATLPTGAVSALSRDRRVVSVVRDTAVVMFGKPSGGQTVPAGMRRIGADSSSTRSGDGRGAVAVNVAVIDSGIDPTHPDLNVAGGVACNGKTYVDEARHGTHVAGTIAAKDDGQGVVGVAPGARLWAVRTMNAKGSGTKSTLLCGIDWVTGTRQDSDPSNDIAVANMSLGGSGKDDGQCGFTDNDVIHQAICRSTAEGVTYVVSTGNSGSDIATTFPAGYDEVLAVSAMVDFDGQPGGAGTGTAECAASVGTTLDNFPFYDDQAAYFSNYATLASDVAHTVAAPGFCVLSTMPGGTYGLESGTSMASPHVAGVVALCIASAACAGLTSAQIIAKVRADALSYLATAPSSGFLGDPSHPLEGKYYGALVRAARY